MRLRHLADVEEGGRLVHLLLQLDAPAPPDRERAPVNLALAIDRSSSMRGPRMAQAVRAAARLVEKLDARDRLAVVTFDASARTVFGPDSLTETNKEKLLADLARLESGVGTNLGAGIKRAADALKSGFVRGAVSRLILLTDGQPSFGITDGDRLGALAESEFQSGVTITAMGIGEGFEDELLTDLARRGRGGFHYLAQAADIPAAFGRELEGVFAIAATDAQLKVVPHADVASADILHRLAARPLEDGLLVEVGEIAAAAPRSILLRLTRVPGAETGHLATMTLTYRGPDGKPADPRIVGIDLPAEPIPEEARAVALERLRLEVAGSVDVAWARRASGDSVHALAALAEVKSRVESERERERVDANCAAALLEDIGAAEAAVSKSRAERERLRRGMKERSQMTLLGKSVMLPLPEEED